MENAHNTDLQRLLDMVALELREQEENMEISTYEVVLYKLSNVNFKFSSSTKSCFSIQECLNKDLIFVIIEFPNFYTTDSCIKRITYLSLIDENDSYDIIFCN